MLRISLTKKFIRRPHIIYLSKLIVQLIHFSSRKNNFNLRVVAGNGSLSLLTILKDDTFYLQASSIMWKAYNFPVYLLSESGISAVQTVILQTCILMEIINMSFCL